jgi:hypothetical protein
VPDAALVDNPTRNCNSVKASGSPLAISEIPRAKGATIVVVTFVVKRSINFSF